MRQDVLPSHLPLRLINFNAYQKMKNSSGKGQCLLSLFYFHNSNNITIDLLSLR